MARVGAQDAHDALPAHHFAVLTNLFYRSSHFHFFQLKRDWLTQFALISFSR
jgi:hypothetical protein